MTNVPLFKPMAYIRNIQPNAHIHLNDTQPEFSIIHDKHPNPNQFHYNLYFYSSMFRSLCAIPISQKLSQRDLSHSHIHIYLYAYIFNLSFKFAKTSPYAIAKSQLQPHIHPCAAPIRQPASQMEYGIRTYWII